MTWLNPPRGYMSPESKLPYHLGESGLVWADDDGDVWETYITHTGFYDNAVHWRKVSTDRRQMLLEKYLVIDPDDVPPTPIEKGIIKSLYDVLVELSLAIDAEQTRDLHPELVEQVRHLTRYVEELKLNEAV